MSNAVERWWDGDDHRVGFMRLSNDTLSDIESMGNWNWNWNVYHRHISIWFCNLIIHNTETSWLCEL